ncbi:peroxisomal membrane protein (Pex16) domain-containing protein [Hirsutella rhossiliensis]|uniref:Peroxisomal membrane protein PEX16 n=1 Tax=Hirsutella rhossiliensis TaxID=111463 RepID=A0A9P8MMQ3_9HYPO|nr:peroxisomal membrane protein (Pex16) domain-containing protein [Hirsutella rhossiliensis]KAH0959053.1 peroxisomal membrane protein (Pex16) domain-containing protein [Hirsutella rhossiliensis]
MPPQPQPQPQAKPVPPRRANNAVAQVLSLPPRWLALYDDFISKNAGQVSQIESALRSLTYIIPGRFRDAEIASESIHSGVQLLSLYHDNLLTRASSTSTTSASHPPPPPAAARSAHARYTRFWAHRSPLYRRVALALQMLVYTQLLCEMAAKRRAGNAARWRVVVAIEAAKALCRLLLLRATRARPLLSPALPEREAVLPGEGDGEGEDNGEHDRGQQGSVDEPMFLDVNGGKHPHEREWAMPRTGMSLPSLPDPADISSYLLGRVLTADDVKPASKLLNRLQGAGHAAEVLHILAPLVYAAAQARGRGAKSWTPWLVGVGVEYAARQLRDRSLRTTALERDEWNKRAWAMAWWAMRGAFYDNVTKGVVGGLTRKMPGFVAGILEDYEYLWENYYFSTSA